MSVFPISVRTLLKEDLRNPQRMDIANPVKLTDTIYKAPILLDAPICFQYDSYETGSHSSPPDDHEKLKAFVLELAGLFKPYYKQWFTKVVDAPIFISRVTHVWNYGTHMPFMGVLNKTDPPIHVTQDWAPDHIRMSPSSYQIHWILRRVEFRDTRNSSGPVAQIVDAGAIPLADTTNPIRIEPGLRFRAKQKIRLARLQLALAEQRVQKLLKKYYSKYGELEWGDGSSVLSSDDERVP